MPDPEDIDRDEIPRRVGKPEEIADIVQLLASSGASYINGRTIPVGGVPHLEREWDVSTDDNPWNW
jgi:NAD(P)-dependent dehydrogenase (short-subunit alcohol dehydrogenase family)